MKIALSLLVLSSTVYGKTYITERPKNIKQMVGVENLLELTEELDGRIADVNNSSMMIKTLSVSSKTDFCMKVGALSATMKSYNKAFHHFIPESAPYFMNKSQSDLHQAANEIDYKIANEMRSLESYCSGQYGLSADERTEIINRIRDAYSDNSLNVNIAAENNEILAPMKTDDLIQHQNEKVKKEKIKKCMLF